MKTPPGRGFLWGERRDSNPRPPGPQPGPNQLTADRVVRLLVDVYKLARVDNPDLSILSDEFLDGLSTKEKPNLQVGLLQRLLDDEIGTGMRSLVCPNPKRLSMTRSFKMMQPVSSMARYASDSRRG
jgi:Domain of unknown function (DUF3387)